MDSVAASNVSFIPSARDLFLVVPRLAQRAGSFAFHHMPEAMDNIAGKIWNGGSIIADATAQQVANSTITNTSAHFAQSTAAALDAAVRETWTTAGDESTSSIFGFVVQGIGKLKSFGGIFSYLTSRWALVTFTAAIVLNRTHFYASSREPLRLKWYARAAIYLVPICAFVTQLIYILQALKCQTSPNFPQLRYGDPLKQLAIDFGGEGGFLYRLSSALLFWEDDASCCTARNMSLIALNDNKSELRGSMSLLFWFFVTLCTGQMFETLACALQGKQPMAETGMTIFEHSLAFAECEAMIGSALGFGFFGLPKLDPSGSTDNAGPLISRAEIMQRLNVPPEVLLVCLISCFAHLSSATLAVTGLRDKVRLVNTAIWSCCYMSAFIWSFLRVILRPAESITDLGVLRFPTVCIIGFVPHLLILVGILVCGSIYGLALLVTALSVPDSAATSLSSRLAWAYNNLQANVQFSSTSSMRVRMSDDFYTTLLKVGFSVLTAASEAVYLNEGSRIHVAQMTWLEQKRIDDLASNLDRRKAPLVPSELFDEGIARGVDFVDQQNAAISFSPYARERTSKAAKGQTDQSQPSELDSGLGVTQRRSRMRLTFDFATGIFWLVTSLQAQLMLRMLTRLGIEQRPAWLVKAAGTIEVQQKPSSQSRPSRADTHDFLMLGPGGRLVAPSTDDVDVELETRRRLERAGIYEGEESLGERLYDWWRSGGWFGNVDASGDYETLGADDDTTSMISMSTNASDVDGWSDVEESGRRTPTQQDPFGDRIRDDTPLSDGALDTNLLSRLLDPQSAAERDEARLLSYSLQSSRPMTRSQYRRNVDRGRAQLLAGLRGQKQPLSEAEEERDLEQFILTQRSNGKAKAVKAGTWESGAEGMGAGGPQCVVCQSTPRTILVWPCGCLSMCDDCRVGLAARNYTKCICCRTDIAAYSRLYVP